MRATQVCSVLAAVSAVLTAVGCWDAYSELYLPLTELECSGGGTGGSGGTTTVDPGCIPSNAGSAIEDMCGVFVSASQGADGNVGTKAEPFATIEKALGASKGKPVYLCGESFAEVVEIKAGALIYGALDCTAEWTYASSKRSVIAAPVDGVALRVTSKASAELYDVNLVAADAATAGGSSIAMLAESGTDVTLTRSDVEAGNGAAGAVGDSPSGSGTPGEKGLDGTGGCDSDAGEFGGSGGQLVCEASNVAGGDGGPGTKNATGGAGSPGSPIGSGMGGLGQGLSVDCMTDGKGGDGTPGMQGDAGAGAPMALGTLSAEGYTGVAGNAGKPGLPGQGGGGGGGGKVCGNGKAGPSGGGGGSGACGGAGGKGGQAGGASIGIVSLGSKLVLDAVNVSTKAGGKGGGGAAGQAGGPGGAVGLPGAAEAAGNSAMACAGGKGGDGGTGGKGGGGLGGHSIGIAHTGEAPDVSGATITTGAAGSGGIGAGDPGSGAAGVAAKVQAF